MTPVRTAKKEEILEQTLERFWETVPPLWGYIRSHIRGTATEKFDISVEQFHLLRFIRKGYCSVSELANARNISRPAISHGVDALVNKGLVSRETSQEDRRYIQLTLTEAGNALLDSVFSNTRAWMKDILEDFSQAELEQANRGMEVLKRMIG